MPRIARAVLQPKRRQDPRQDRAHLDWLKTLPCLGCGKRPPCDPAHLRFSTADEPLHAGAGLKPPDKKAVPLCRACHDREEAGKITFWGARMAQGVSDPIGVAQRLHRISGDTERGYAAIAHARPGLQTAWLPA